MEATDSYYNISFGIINGVNTSSSAIIDDNYSILNDTVYNIFGLGGGAETSTNSATTIIATTTTNSATTIIATSSDLGDFDDIIDLQNNNNSSNNNSEVIATTISSAAIAVARNTLIFGIKSQYTPLEAILTGILLLTIIVVTVIGNVLVCLAVFLVRKLRRPCNYLLVSLAVSDLCVAILVMPMAMMYEILGRWNFGNFVCDLWVSFDVLSCTASILNLCMISVDRYFAITKPLEYGVKRTPKRMIACVSLVWLAAACISLPPLLILGNEHEVIDGVNHCVVCQNFAYQIYATLGSFYIPLVVMITVYYKIFCAARRIVLEERKAQTHLETNHCYLEISVKNGGGGPPESRLATATTNLVVTSSYDCHPPDTSTSTTTGRCVSGNHHRTSTASTATTCSVGGIGANFNGNNNNNNSHDGAYDNSRCFGGGSSRPSNESQCPMLLQSSSSTMSCCNNKSSSFRHHHHSQHNRNHQRQTKKTTKFKSSTKKSKKNSLGGSSTRLGGRASGVTIASNSSTVSHTKKLRFQLAKERKASTTLGIIMSAFTICWLPFFVLALVRPFLKNSKTIPSSLSSFFLWLGYANSLLNPVIYATLNRDFRRPFQQILFFRCGSLNHMMREEFYHSQYGDPDPPQHFYVSSCGGGNNSPPEKLIIQNTMRQIRSSGHHNDGEHEDDSSEVAMMDKTTPTTTTTMQTKSFPTVPTCIANESFL